MISIKGIADTAVSLCCGRSNIESDDKRLVHWINEVLTEMEGINAKIRENKGLSKNNKLKKIDNLDEHIFFEPELFSAICYSLAAKIMFEEEDIGLYFTYKEQGKFLIYMLEKTISKGGITDA